MKSFSSLQKFFIVFSVLAIALPYVSFATSNTYTLPDIKYITSLNGPYLVCTGAPQTPPQGAKTLPVCHDLCDLVAQAVTIVYIMIAWVLWVIAPLSFVVGGLMYMLTGVNSEMQSTAKNILKSAVIGVVIVLCAYIIVSTFINFFSISGIGGFGSPTCTIK